MYDYRRFLDFLSGNKSGAVLFEPLVDKKLVTQIIWRGGAHLWNTTAHRCETLIEFYSYIKSDVVIIEAFGDAAQIIDAAVLPEGMKLVIISDDSNELAIADESDKVCALATRESFVETQKPLILLARDNEAAEDTFARADRFAAVYLRERAEAFADKAVVLGGIGAAELSLKGPLKIYERVEQLDALGCAIGSGATNEYTEYLGFISMLGMYDKLK